jgi:hypothetical protein
MMTQQLELSILAAPLAAIDRRALSQAWYSALHLARPPQSAAPFRQLGPCSVSSSASKTLSDETQFSRARSRDARVPHQVLAKPPPATTAQSSAARIPADRRIAPLSQRIERRFTDSPTPVKRATFSMGRGAARVHVILQTNGNVANLVALCRPDMETIVARALAQAGLALARRGFAIDLRVRGALCS